MGCKAEHSKVSLSNSLLPSKGTMVSIRQDVLASLRSESEVECLDKKQLMYKQVEYGKLEWCRAVKTIHSRVSVANPHSSRTVTSPIKKQGHSLVRVGDPSSKCMHRMVRRLRFLASALPSFCEQCEVWRLSARSLSSSPLSTPMCSVSNRVA